MQCSAGKHWMLLDLHHKHTYTTCTPDPEDVRDMCLNNFDLWRTQPGIGLGSDPLSLGQWDRCGCPVMPGARVLAVDRLSPVAPWIRHVLAKSYECSIGLGSWEFGVSRIVYCRDNKGRWNGWAGGNMDYCRSWGIGRVLKWQPYSSCPLDVLRLSFLTAPTIHTPIKTHHQPHGHQSFHTHHHFSKLLTWNGILYAHPHTHTAILVSVFLKDTSSRQKLVQVQGR